MSATEEESDDETEEEQVRTGSLVVQSLPHEYEREALDFEVDTFQLDGTRLGERGELDENNRYLTIEDEAGWETLTVEGTVELREETLREVFPPDEWDSPPGRLVVVKTNRLAISRDRTVVRESPLEEGTASIEIEIERDEHRGTINLQPFLTRATERGPGGTNHASKAGSRLSDGTPWTIRLDRRTDGGGLLMPIIEDFDDSDRFPGEKHIHYLSMDEPQNPQLYLNRSHPQVVNVLENNGATGGPPRLRDVLYDYIEHSVWTQLLMHTARDTDTDTGETKYAWQDDVLDLFLDELYPEMDDEQAAAQLATDVRSVEDLPALVQNIERAVHQQYDIPSDTTKLIEEAIQRDD
jgi:hypothetical protein